MCHFLAEIDEKRAYKYDAGCFLTTENKSVAVYQARGKVVFPALGDANGF
jgi:hypothetical protein